MESLVLEGLVEAIIFKSEDTGYTVAKITANKELITIVGVMPLLQEGQQIEVKGKFIQHKQFGRQFSVEEYKEKLPSSSKEIEKYLSTGIIRGIGPVTAKKIVKAFGKDTLDILDNHIERLKEVEGIGEKKFNIIYESYIETKDLKDIMIYFQGFGITHGQCLKIYKRFGPNAKDIVQKDPYILCREIKGIGFATADRIGSMIGINRESDSRIKSGIDFVINHFKIDREDTFAFGDSNNDIPMLENVKNSIVMGNGNPDLFEKATFVTKHIDEDGIEHAMKHFKIIE